MEGFERIRHVITSEAEESPRDASTALSMMPPFGFAISPASEGKPIPHAQE